MTGLEFRLLGPVEVQVGGFPLDLGPRKQRAVLAALLVAVPEVVALDTLVDQVWGERPPQTAAHALQVYVANLRRLLEPNRAARSPGSVLVTRDPGYQLVAGADQIDASRFETGLAAARRLGPDDAEAAADQLAALLDLWHGPALSDFADEDWARAEAARLDGLRLSATEAMFTAALAAGRHAAVVDQLEDAARRHPFREALWHDLIVALYRCGRQADALYAYATVRAHLLEELGVEPGAPLRKLETAVLRQDPSLARAGRDTSAPRPQPDPPRMVDEPRDERRIVSVLFADLEGSTPLGEVLDDDEYKLVIDGAIERMIAVCERFGGRVVNVAGDGVTALFGAPVAHEDDAERAVLAGREIVEDIEAYGHDVARSWGVQPVRARVGVNSGPVITGFAGAGDYAAYSATGDIVNTAKRLESAAEPGTVLVGAAVRGQLGPDFTFSDARQLDLRGKAEPVEAYEATGGRPGGGRPRGLPGRQTRLVGRTAELDVLTQLADEVNAGRGGALLLSSEAGLGKSRLLGELHDACMLHADPARLPLWLEGSCISYGDSRPLWPVRRLVDSWIGLSPGMAAMRSRIALRRAVDDLFDRVEADRVYRAMAALTGCDDDASSWPQSVPEEARQREIHDSLRLLVERLAADRPVIIAIDDLHWADDETLDLLDHLLPSIDPSPVLVALASRPEPGHPSWRIRERLLSEFAHRTRVVELGALPPQEDRDLLDELVGSEALPEALRGKLLHLAHGNPLFLEELVRSLIAAGTLVQTDGAFVFRGDVDDLRLPETVEQVVVSRLDRLDTNARRVLTAAAAIGREFESELLAAIVDDAAALDPILVDLQRLALVREVRRWPTPEYRFEHPLTQEAAHATLVGVDRREVHRRLADVLLGHPGVEGAQARVAHHLELAGDDAAAARAYREAAEDAFDRGLVRAAFTLSAAGRQVVDRLGDSADASVAGWLVYIWLLTGSLVHGTPFGDEDVMPLVDSARDADDAVLETRLLVSASYAHMIRGDESRRRQRLIEALSGARRANDLTTLAYVLSRLVIDEANSLELDEALARASEAMALTEGAPVQSRLVALDARKLVALYLGELDVLGDVVEEAFSLSGRRRAQQTGAPLPLEFVEAFFVAEAALLDQAGGRIAAALAKADRALARGEDEARLGQGVLPEFLAIKCRIARSCGSYAEALDAGLAGYGPASETGHGYWLPWTAAEYGAVLTEVGALGEAVEVLAGGATAPQASMRSQQLRCAGLLALAGLFAADHHAEATGIQVAERLLSRSSLPDGHSYLYGADAMLAIAEVHARRGRVDDATAIAATYTDAVERAGWLEPAARGRSVLGLIAASRGDHDTAIRELRQSIERAAGLWPGIEWRSRAELARITGDEAERASAGALVEKLCGSLDTDMAGALRDHAASLL